MGGENSAADRMIDRDNSALIIIDVQEVHLPVMAEPEEVLQNSIKLARGARIFGLPVIVSEQRKLGSTRTELLRELIDPQPFTKVSFDCLADEAIRKAIAETGRRKLILCGIESHVCVVQTALSALDQYQVHVAANAVSSRSPADKAVGLDRLRAEGVIVTTTEMVIFELLRGAGAPEFKDVLKIVK